jgi:NitT/TauT family transport system permease protein
MTHATATTARATARRRGASRVAPGARAWLAPGLLALLGLAGWTVAARGVPAFLLPSPAAVAAKVATGLSDGSMWPTSGHVPGGRARLSGRRRGRPALAVTIHRSRWADAATRPFLGGTQAIPAIALAAARAVARLRAGRHRRCAP